MITHQFVMSGDSLKPLRAEAVLSQNTAHLVLVMAERVTLEATKPYAAVQAQFPNATIVTVSTAGQIAGAAVYTDQPVVTAIQFTDPSTQIKAVQVSCQQGEVFAAQSIQQQLSVDGLRGICIFSDGSLVNGTELLKSLAALLPTKDIPIFGGLAGDGALFERTLVGIGSAVETGQIVAIGFYGERLQFGFGSQGGWSGFGPEREVTSSDKNVLHSIGNVPALDLYREYLGKHAEGLPSAALFFPLTMRSPNGLNDTTVVRTILSIDEANKSMTFAGSLEQGAKVRLSKSSSEDLIHAALMAAIEAKQGYTHQTQLALLVSCVGRRLVLGDRTEEELEVIIQILGAQTVMAGFYSYGEISPSSDSVLHCDLHNQTMTIATISEV